MLSMVVPRSSVTPRVSCSPATTSPISAPRAGERDRVRVQEVTSNPEFGGGRGDFRPDEPRAHDDQPAARHQFGRQFLAVLQRAQGVDVGDPVQCRQRRAEAPVAITMPSAVTVSPSSPADGLGLAVQADRAAPSSHSASRSSSAPSSARSSGRDPAQQEILGQRRPVVRAFRFVPDNDEPALKALGAGSARRGKTGQGCPYDRQGLHSPSWGSIASCATRTAICNNFPKCDGAHNAGQGISYVTLRPTQRSKAPLPVASSTPAAAVQRRLVVFRGNVPDDSGPSWPCTPGC